MPSRNLAILLLLSATFANENCKFSQQQESEIFFKMLKVLQLIKKFVSSENVKKFLQFYGILKQCRKDDLSTLGEIESDFNKIIFSGNSGMKIFGA